MDPVLNINGETNSFKGYNADVLTEQALDWLKRDQRNHSCYMSAVTKPFTTLSNLHRVIKEGITEKKLITLKPWPSPRKTTKPSLIGYWNVVTEFMEIDHMETGAFDKDPVPSLTICTGTLRKPCTAWMRTLAFFSTMSINLD